MKSTPLNFGWVALACLLSTSSFATKLGSVKVLDENYLHLHFYDGEVTFRDDAMGTCPHDHCEDLANSIYTAFGSPLNTSMAQQNGTYSITSVDDPNFSSGIQPTDVHRKTNMSGMKQKNWVGDDYTYDFAMEHQLYLELPQALENGKTYTLTINSGTNTDETSVEFTYNLYESRSEAIKVNIVGYATSDAIKAADVYYWMGDGNARDYSSFEGNKVYLYNVSTEEATEVGSLDFGTSEATEQTHGHPMLQSSTWNADFTGFNTAGTYRLAVEGIGCSDDFEISDDVYRNPFGVSVQGFFYMRIGQEDYAPGYPVPRQPLWIPNTSPADCKVYITTMQPYHPEWNSMCNGCDKWDIKGGKWADYVKPGSPTNPNAFGGHSDALDWDRYLGHVSIIYDMLLPYIVTGGVQNDDDLGIAESGNGIPDLLDEAQNEVDFWLRLRDGMGYAHGLNNPDGTNALYQAGTTAVAAWANAANASMLAYAYDIAGEDDLRNTYRDSAVVAYSYASNLGDQQLSNTQGVGMNSMTGLDFKNTAAAFLYNLTGNTDYELQVVNNLPMNSGQSQVTLSNIYAVAGYLFTPQVIHHSAYYDNMKSSTMYQAIEKEAKYADLRPSRRTTDNSVAWMQTEISVHRSIVAHAIAEDGSDKSQLEDALILEADYSLGRNPMNRILMTTATTPLQNERSCEEAFTSGWDDGSPGVHPGHTPYLNPYSWGGDRYMGNPEKMAALSYPTVWQGDANPGNMQWPMGEMYFNTRFVYAHTEFTPQQTMRGKTALYAYLYAVSTPCQSPNLGSDVSICGFSQLQLDAGIDGSGKTISWEGPNGTISSATSPQLTVTEAGEYTITVDDAGCIRSDEIMVKAELPSVFLGEDQDLCEVTSLVLDAKLEGPGFTYAWAKDGVTLADAEGKTLTVDEAGVYEATVSVSGCLDGTGQAEITSSLLLVLNDARCGAGEVELSVTGVGNYSWHAGPLTDDLLTETNSFSTNLNTTTTYYVEEETTVSGQVGPTGPGTSTWGSWTESFADDIEFTVSQPLTIKSVKVAVQNSGTVKINLYKDGNELDSHSEQVSISGLNTIPVNFAITTPGVYHIDLLGTTASLTLDNENGDYISYPYTLGDVLSIDQVVVSWGSLTNRWMYAYDWEIEYVGSACARTPVTGFILDPQSPECLLNSIPNNHEQDKFTFAPNPTEGLIEFSEVTDFQVFTLQGVQLMTGTSTTVNLSALPQGSYILKAKGENHVLVKQ